MDPIYLLNSEGEKIQLDKSKKYKWYNCGPTIYNRSHLGHARTFITIDTMRRFYKDQGLKIEFGSNITDIDDKIIKSVKNKYGVVDFKHYYKYIHEYESYYKDDMKSLNILDPDILLKVSETIPHILEYIDILLEKGYAYIGNNKTKHGYSVYFNTNKYIETYGKTCLDKSSDDDLTQKDIDESDKNDPKDFALWKVKKSVDDIGFFSQLGLGRPGWHIECSTMASLMFGDTVQIHSGGIDLAYPHHNNECLQSNSLFEKKNVFENFIHIGHLHINKEKMSQSLGNFVTINDYLKTHSPNSMRLLFLNSNWKHNLDLSEELIKYSEVLDSKIYELLNTLNHNLSTIPKSDLFNHDIILKVNEWKQSLIGLLANNFSSSEFLHRFEIIMTEINKTIILSLQENSLYFDLIKWICNILGLVYNLNIDDKAVHEIVDIRERIRSIAIKSKVFDLFSLSDYVRDDVLIKLGYKLDDSKYGGKLKKL